MGEILREKAESKVRLVVICNAKFISKIQKLASESGTTFDKAMDEMFKIGEGVFKARVENGDSEIRIKFQNGGIKIEGYKTEAKSASESLPK